jgi:hypothetical protein
LHIRSIIFLGLDGVCGARDGLKGSKGEPGLPGEAGKSKYLSHKTYPIVIYSFRNTWSTWYYRRKR